MTNTSDPHPVGSVHSIDRDIAVAPLPTAATLRHRRSLPAQAVRFAALNARIMRMVIKGHHG